MFVKWKKGELVDKYPPSKSEEHLGVKRVNLALLLLDGLHPLQNTRVSARKSSSVLVERFAVHFESTHGQGNFFSSPCLEIFEVIQSGQRLWKVDLRQIRWEALVEEANDETGR